MAINKNNNESQLDVAREIIKTWYEYALDELFQITFFLFSFEEPVEYLSLYDSSYYLEITRIKNDFNLKLAQSDETEIFNSSLKDLNKILNRDLCPFIIQTAEIILKRYEFNLCEKNKVLEILEKTKNMKQEIKSRQFLVEKL
jgi:hypothetical protein